MTKAIVKQKNSMNEVIDQWEIKFEYRFFNYATLMNALPELGKCEVSDDKIEIELL